MMVTQPRVAISVQGLSVAYRDVLALEGISFDVPSSAVTGIIGPNGAGKTTLLHATMGMLSIRAGEIRIFGMSVRDARRRVAYVPQREAVDWQFPVTVADVALMGRYGTATFGRRLSRQDHDIALEALEVVGMAGYARRQIGMLSGGQQQRVFLARALAQQADILILDEPFSGIDAASQETIFSLMTTLKKSGKTMLLSTHDLTSIRSHCDYVLCLNRRVVAFGPVATTFRIEVLNRTYGGHVLHLHEGEGIVLP